MTYQVADLGPGEYVLGAGVYVLDGDPDELETNYVAYCGPAGDERAIEDANKIALLLNADEGDR